MRLHVGPCLLLIGFGLVSCSHSDSPQPVPPDQKVVTSPSATPDPLTEGSRQIVARWVPRTGYGDRESGVYEFRTDKTFECTRQEEFTAHPEFGRTTVVLSGNYALDASVNIAMKGKITFGVKSVKLSNGNAAQQTELDQFAAQLTQQFQSSPDLASDAGWSGGYDVLDFNTLSSTGLTGNDILFDRKL